MIRTLSLFSGIGGFDLGVERTGLYEVVGQSEIDPYACRVLSKHWPTVPNLGDITKITEAHLEPIGRIDAVIGGFPCQDLSVAGKQGGIRAARSGLFFELMRIVRLVRPSLVILENVPTLLCRADWMGAVLGKLAESGFDAEWDCIPAQAVGAPHRRDRVFVVAYAPSEQGRRIQQPGLSPDAGAGGQDVADANGARRDDERTDTQHKDRHKDDARAEHERTNAQPRMGRGDDGVSAWIHPTAADAFGPGWEDHVSRTTEDRQPDRLRGLGNAIVPQVAEHVARIAASRTHARQRHDPKPHQPTTPP